MSSVHREIEDGSLGSRRKQSVLPTKLAAPSGAIRLSTSEESPTKTPNEKTVTITQPPSGRSSHDGLGGSSSGNSEGEMAALSQSNARFYRQQEALEREAANKGGGVHYSPTGPGNNSTLASSSTTGGGGRSVGGSRPASSFHGRAIPVVPRNFWQVVPTNHLYIIGILYATYLVILAAQNATTIVTLLHTRYIEHCDIRVIGFLISWSVCGMVYLASLVIWTWLFVKHILPHYLKSARPLAKGLVRYSILVGFFCFSCATVCVYGLWSSRFDDPNTERKHPGTVRCGVSAAVTKAVSGSFLLMTFLFLVFGYVYHRWAEKRLERKAKRATAGTINLLTGNDTEQGHIFTGSSSHDPSPAAGATGIGLSGTAATTTDRPSRDSHDPTVLTSDLNQSVDGEIAASSSGVFTGGASGGVTDNKYAARLHHLQLTPMKSKEKPFASHNGCTNGSSSLDLKVRPTMLRPKKTTVTPPAASSEERTTSAVDAEDAADASRLNLLAPPAGRPTAAGANEGGSGSSPPINGLEPMPSSSSALNHSRSSSRGGGAAFVPYAASSCHSAVASDCGGGASLGSFPVLNNGQPVAGSSFGAGAYTPRSSNEGDEPTTPRSLAAALEVEATTTPRGNVSSSTSNLAAGVHLLHPSVTSAAGAHRSSNSTSHSRRVSELSTASGPLPFAGSAAHRSTSNSQQ